MSGRQLSVFDLLAGAGDPTWAPHWTEASAMAAWAALANEGWRVTQNDPGVRPNDTSPWRKWCGVAVWPEPVGPFWPALVAEETNWASYALHPREGLPVRVSLVGRPDAVVADGPSGSPERWGFGYWRPEPSGLRNGAGAWGQVVREELEEAIARLDEPGVRAACETAPVADTWRDQLAAWALAPGGNLLAAELMDAGDRWAASLPAALAAAITAETGDAPGRDPYRSALEFDAWHYWRAHALLRDWPAGFMGVTV